MIQIGITKNAIMQQGITGDKVSRILLDGSRSNDNMIILLSDDRWNDRKYAGGISKFNPTMNTENHRLR